MYCSEHKDVAISSLSMGDLGTVWVVYEDGSVWFTHGVCRKNPKGSGRWWQVQYLNVGNSRLQLMALY